MTHKLSTATAGPGHRAIYQGKPLGYEENVKESKMKKLFLMLVVLALLMAPVIAVADTTDTKSVTLAATWEGGVQLTLDKAALTFPVLQFPHDDSTWVSSNEGAFYANLKYCTAAGHAVTLTMNSEAWNPVTDEYGPEETIRVSCDNGGSHFVAAPPVGQEAELWRLNAGTDPNVGEGSVQLDIQVLDINVSPASRTTTLSFILADVL